MSVHRGVKTTGRSGAFYIQQDKYSLAPKTDAKPFQWLWRLTKVGFGCRTLVTVSKQIFMRQI